MRKVTSDDLFAVFEDLNADPLEYLDWYDNSNFEIGGNVGVEGRIDLWWFAAKLNERLSS